MLCTELQEIASRSGFSQTGSGNGSEHGACSRAILTHFILGYGVTWSHHRNGTSNSGGKSRLLHSGCCNIVRGSCFASQVARERSFSFARHCICPRRATANASKRSRRPQKSSAARCSQYNRFSLHHCALLSVPQIETYWRAAARFEGCPKKGTCRSPRSHNWQRTLTFFMTFLRSSFVPSDGTG